MAELCCPHLAERRRAHLPQALRVAIAALKRCRVPARAAAWEDRCLTSSRAPSQRGAVVAPAMAPTPKEAPSLPTEVGRAGKSRQGGLNVPEQVRGRAFHRSWKSNPSGILLISRQCERVMGWEDSAIKSFSGCRGRVFVLKGAAKGGLGHNRTRRAVEGSFIAA